MITLAEHNSTIAATSTSRIATRVRIIITPFPPRDSIDPVKATVTAITNQWPQRNVQQPTQPDTVSTTKGGQMIDKIFPKKPGAEIPDPASVAIQAAKPAASSIARIAAGVMVGILLAFAILAIGRKAGIDIHIPVRETLSDSQQKAIDDTDTEDVSTENDYLSTP